MGPLCMALIYGVDNSIRLKYILLLYIKGHLSYNSTIRSVSRVPPNRDWTERYRLVGPTTPCGRKAPWQVLRELAMGLLLNITSVERF